MPDLLLLCFFWSKGGCELHPCCGWALSFLVMLQVLLEAEFLWKTLLSALL